MAICLKHDQVYKPESGEEECPQCKREREDEIKSNQVDEEQDLMK